MTVGLGGAVLADDPRDNRQRFWHPNVGRQTQVSAPALVAPTDR